MLERNMPVERPLGSVVETFGGPEARHQVAVPRRVVVGRLVQSQLTDDRLCSNCKKTPLARKSLPYELCESGVSYRSRPHNRSADVEGEGVRLTQNFNGELLKHGELRWRVDRWCLGDAVVGAQAANGLRVHVVVERMAPRAAGEAETPAARPRSAAGRQALARAAVLGPAEGGTIGRRVREALKLSL